jgi:hydroxysqualene synthase
LRDSPKCTLHFALSPTDQIALPVPQHYENFPVASLLCPPHLRGVITAIYWFARTADDLADEGNATTEQRLTDLAAYRYDLHACASIEPGASVSPRWPDVFNALAPHIQAFQLPVSLLDDLLKAFAQDVDYTEAGHWYADHAELLAYCARSANPVGRLLLHLYGVHDKISLHASDAICSALQLINFWQDLSRDIPNKRYYLPRDLMQLCSVRKSDLLTGIDTPDTAKLVAHCTGLARATMRKGIHLPERVGKQIGGFSGWRASLELRCVIQGGLRITDKIQQLKHRTLSQRPKLGKWDACVVLWRALWM